jgi:pimeloyl-ACP methyl ester carboxylesterase
MVQNERAFIQKISAADPTELTRIIIGADAQEERILRIYLGAAQYDAIRQIALQVSATRGPAALLGNVIVLHGIMGGELSLFNNGGQSLIWVSVLHLLQGQFDRLPLDDHGVSIRDVRASGIFMRYYASQLVNLSRQWNVRPFFFDWRRDIRLAARDLAAKVNSWFPPGAKVHLVAHSMGGLVARSYAAQFPNWGNGGRLIMLGTPNYGSFTVPRLLFGTNEVLQLVAKVDFSHNVQDLLRIAKTFPGIYQMLPVRGHLNGLDVLYKSATYTLEPIAQQLLDDAEVFQQSISAAIDPARMVYVAGYNRRTMADLNDITQLGSDNGYVLSRRGDGTVPHDLGLLSGVKTFFVDEEHQALPANAKVQAAMTELLQTGDQATEQFLWKGLGPEFAGDRGLGGEESQPTMLAAEAARKSAKEQQAVILRNLLASRGTLRPEVVSVEEQALADVIMRHDALPMSVSGDEAAGRATLVPTAVAAAVNASPSLTDVSLASSHPTTQQELPPPETTVRMRIVLAGSISELERKPVANEVPVDCIAVGHYLRVPPSGAELDLDRAVSPFYRSATQPDEELVLTQFHERGILRGDLGVPFFLPDPRNGFEGSLLCLAGMGPAGGFGVPELTLLARELSWSLGQLGKKHLATVFIGASRKNLSYADAIHGWLVGLSRALASAKSMGTNSLEAVTFVVRNQKADLSTIVAALQREAAAMSADPMYNLKVQLLDLPPVATSRQTVHTSQVATRISVSFEDGICRYSALTDGASIAERAFRIKPGRIAEINSRLLAASDGREKYKLGKFLLDFLFPRDLRSQLSGGAPIVLICNNDAAKVYWEMAAQPLEDEEGTVAGDENYLGLTRGLTRQLRTILAPPPEPPPPVSRVLRVLLVADGSKEHPLPGAQEEAQMILDLFERVNAANLNTGNRILCTALVGPSKATVLDTLLQVSSQPPYDVLHYAGHCVFKEGSREGSGFLFSGGDLLTADDMDRVDRTPKFVFANACESGILPSRPDLSSPGLPAAFAEAFFEKGVANFVCTAWPVGDVAAKDFAQELYRHLLGDGTPPVEMYEAMRHARLAIKNTRTWGSYQHYGNPGFRLIRAKTTTT